MSEFWLSLSSQDIVLLLPSCSLGCVEGHNGPHLSFSFLIWADISSRQQILLCTPSTLTNSSGMPLLEIAIPSCKKLNLFQHLLVGLLATSGSITIGLFPSPWWCLARSPHYSLVGQEWAQQLASEGRLHYHISHSHSQTLSLKTPQPSPPPALSRCWWFGSCCQHCHLSGSVVAPGSIGCLCFPDNGHRGCL